MTDEQRKRFEAWAKTENLVNLRSQITHCKYDYVSNTTETAWRAWLEAARQNSAYSDPSPFREPFTNSSSGMGIPKR